MGHPLIELPNYDKAIIVTGDGDFHCLVKHLKGKGKLGKLVIPNQHRFSSLLREFVPGDVVFMNKLRSKLGYRAQKKRGIAAGQNPLDSPSS